MSHSTVLDVLIVYNGHIATSASDTPTMPFALGTANAAYAYFLTTCRKLGLRAGLSSSLDIIGTGSCRSYWTFLNQSWIKNDYSCRAKQIFDKFSPKDETSRALRHLLFSSSRIRSFNSYSLFKLFFDKQKTHDALSDYTIPTLTLKNSALDSIKKTCTALTKMISSHPYPRDFGNDIILKDRYGAGGHSIYKFKSDDYVDIQQTLQASPNLSFIIQPLIKFDRGFKYQNRFVSTDIRLIYFKDKIVSTYLRMAKSGDFRCNQHQGGSLAYLAQSAIPKPVMTQSRVIAKILNKKSSLFTLDFLLSNSGHSYLLEGNTGPGLSWDPADKIDQLEAKKLIRLIVKTMAIRHQKSRPHHSPNHAYSPLQSTNHPSFLVI